MIPLQKYSIAFFIGYLLIIVGAVLHIINDNNVYGVYVFGAGVLLNVVFRYFLLPRSDNKRIRRLNTQQFFVVALYIFTGYCMWKHKNYWAIPLIMSAIIDLWLSFRYPEKVKN